PEATFRSTSVEAAGEGRLKVTGELTIKDITREVVLDATLNHIGPHPMTEQPTAGFDAKATIKRSDFGLGLFVPNVADEIELHITTEAPAADAESNAPGSDDAWSIPAGPKPAGSLPERATRFLLIAAP